MKSLKLNLAAATMAATVATAGSFAAPETAQAEVSYNIGIHSKYLLRGIYEENTGAAVQGGVDWAHKDGWYAGWWFSSLSYNTPSTTDTEVAQTGVENDFYGGYSGTFGDGFGWDVGLIQYYYLSVDDSDLTEATGTLTYKDFYVGLQYLLNDGAWGNSGDIYWKAGWATSLPNDFGLGIDFGYYTYDKSDNSKLSYPTGFTQTTSSGGFRHLNFVVSKPIAKTGAEAYVQYTVAGEDRFKREFDNTMVFGVTYGF